MADLKSISRSLVLRVAARFFSIRIPSLAIKPNRVGEHQYDGGEKAKNYKQNYHCFTLPDS
jgi:hypothetical protein